MGYVYFDFCPFGVKKRVTSLGDLIHFVDEELDFIPLKHLQLHIARDIAKLLARQRTLAPYSTIWKFVNIAILVYVRKLFY